MLALDAVNRVTGREERVGLGIPGIIVDAVENPAELVLILLESAAEPGGAVIIECLVGVVGRYRGHEIRIEDAALHRVKSPVPEIISQPVGIEEMIGATQPGGPEHLFVTGALMAEVVDGIADSLVRHDLAILLIEQHRDEPGLPVVAVNDIGTFIRSINSSAALEKNANRSASSPYPYRRSRPKKSAAECGSMKKHFRPFA